MFSKVGAGAALLHEKIIALASARFVIIADETKLVDHLGERPLPVEVVNFGWPATRDSMDTLGGILRICGGPESPLITDSGNVIIHVVPPSDQDTVGFAAQLKALTGVVDHGVFVGLER